MGVRRDGGPAPQASETNAAVTSAPARHSPAIAIMADW
jgi:hypothetical protein